MVRVVIVTGRGFRHLWMIELARRALGESLVGVLIQAAEPLPTGGNDRWSRFKRSTKRTLAQVGVQMPVYLDLTPPERHLWRQHGEPKLDWQHLGVEHVRVTADPNSAESIAWFDRVAPDLVVVFGGRILTAPWFEQPRLGAINMHYGITPDYRGADSIVWAAYHGNWSKIGATVHYVDAGIDTGPVIQHIPVQVQRGDDLDTLTARVYWAGINALVDCASRCVQQDKRLPVVPAQHHRGQCYAAKSCSYEIRRTADLYIRQREERTRAPSNGHSAQQPAFHRWSESLARRSPADDRLAPGVYMFLYHDLSFAADRPWKNHAQISTDPNHFCDHLRYLSDRGRWVPAEDAYSRLARNEVTEPLLVLTFDDGFASVFHHARAIVTELGIQPKLFLNGATLAEGHVHYRVLAAILAAENRSDVLHESIMQSAARGPRARIIRSSRMTPHDVLQWLKRNYDPKWTDNVTTSAYHQVHGHLPNSLYMNRDQIAELIAEGWTIGNHTWTHARLANLTPAQVADELDRNERWFTDFMGTTPDWISYPYGFTADVGSAAIEWVERDPARVGVMAEGGVNLVLERTALRRIPVGDHNLTPFRQQLHQSILRSQQEHFQTLLNAV